MIAPRPVWYELWIRCQLGYIKAPRLPRVVDSTKPFMKGSRGGSFGTSDRFCFLFPTDPKLNQENKNGRREERS